MFSRKALIRVAAVAALAAAPSVSLAQGGGGQNQGTGQATVGNLIAALNNISVEIGELNALNNIDISDVRVVDVDNVLNDNNVQAFNNALNRNNVEILNLRNNTILQNVLNNWNVANNPDIVITDVVAIDVLSGGDLVIFTR